MIHTNMNAYQAAEELGHAGPGYCANNASFEVVNEDQLPIIEITATATGKGLYTACVSDRVLCEYVKEPFFAACRVLVREGVPEDTLVTMRYEHQPYPSFRPMRLVNAAKLTVRETESEGPRITRYQPPAKNRNESDENEA